MKARITVGALACWLLAPALASAQTQSFDYRVERRFSGTGGAYAGWSDELVASGHYDVTFSSPQDAQIHGAYQWRYSSPEGVQTGTEDRRVPVVARTYTSGIDLDEYDGQDVTRLATWVFVPTGLSVGDTVPILESSFRVVEAPAQVQVAGAMRSAVHVRAEGDGSRHDAYGDFATHWTDEYWFDAATGLFLREVRDETDEGSTDAERASLAVHEEVVIIGASYAPAIGAVPPDPLLQRPRIQPARHWMLYALPIGGALMSAVFVAIFLFLRPRRSSELAVAGVPVETQKLEGPIPADLGKGSLTFAPFLPHFVAVARGTHDRVVVASRAGALTGVAIDDGSTGIASIFAVEPEDCEALRRAIGRDDFFSEILHGNLTEVVRASARTGTKLPSSRAYNLLETYEVLALTPAKEPTYDAQVVTRLTDAERGTAADLLTRVLGVPCKNFLEAALDAGDLAYVARVDGAIAGVGLATVVGTHGRLHTLAVDPAHRNRGLGRELVRARVRAMMALGATRILTEVAVTNAASLELIRGEGFTKIADMYLESARSEAPATPPTTVRR